MARIGKEKQNKKTQFKEKQRVVIPLQGVGQIVSVEERHFKEQDILYYIIYLDVSDMTIMAPVDRAQEMGIRSIVSPRLAEKALNMIAEVYEPVAFDWKTRYQINLDMLKMGDINNTAIVTRGLYHRSLVKELPVMERKLFESALHMFVDEISFALGQDKKSIEKMVLERMNKNIPDTSPKKGQ